MAGIFLAELRRLLRCDFGSHRLKYRWCNYVVSAVLYASAIRLVLIWWNMVHKQDWYIRHEIAAVVAIEGRNYPPNLMLCVVFLSIFTEHTNRFFYLRFATVARAFLPLLEDLSLNNFDAIVESNWELFRNFSLSIYSKQSRQLLWHLWRQDRAPREHRISTNRKLRCFAGVTTFMRARILVVMIVCEVTFWHLMNLSCELYFWHYYCFN